MAEESVEYTSRRDKMRERLLRGLPKGGVVAEVGVWEGNFSQRILEICEPSRLHLIDPWEYQPEFWDTGFGRGKNRDRLQPMYEGVCERYASDPRVSVHREKSETALAGFDDHYFDWVYLDGNHNWPFIDYDLATCMRKVKPGGIIAGDDYAWKSEEKGAPVKRAVGIAMSELGPEARLDLIANQWAIYLPK